MSTTVINLLEALRTHLNDFDLPEPYSVHVIMARDRPEVTVHLTTHHLPELATGLLAWADTLTEVTVEAWRVPQGDSVHLSVIGRLSGGVLVQVYGGMPFTEHGIGADLAPGASKTVSWAVLRERATPGEVTLS
jgi:hypothetical protein